MTAWTSPLQEPPPAGAPAREVEPVLWAMVPDAHWFTHLSECQQKLVLRHLCKEAGWYWPEVAKVIGRGGIHAEPNRLTASQRSQQARRASYSSWARTDDPAQRTAPARKALMSRFEREVDPEGKLPLAQRQQMAAHAKRAHFAGLALKSSVARARKGR